MTVLDNEVPPLRRTGERAELSLGRSPVPLLYMDLELSEPLPPLVGDCGDRQSRPDGDAAFVLVRLHRRPVTTVLLAVPPEGLRPAHLAAEIWRLGSGAIIDHLRSDGLPDPLGLDEFGLGEPRLPDCIQRRQSLLERAPHISVVVATRERPRQLQRCLESLARVVYPSFDVVVVDNDPVTGATADLVRSRCWGFPTQYAVEERRGLAAAHNKGIALADGDILAFTDDDVVVDPDWLGGVAEGFLSTDQVGAVTGLILPAELRTRSQLLLEQHAGFAKGFVPALFDLHEHRPADPLFPFAAGRLGSGANMAFDAQVLRRMGGFDPAMGTGTAALGGDDLVALFSVVASGHRLAYAPDAVVFHYHRDDVAALGRQSFGYGVGLGAYLTNVAVHHPLLALGLLRCWPSAWQAARSLASDRSSSRYDGWPPELARLETSGILRGPGSYVRSRWQNRQAVRPGGHR